MLLFSTRIVFTLSPLYILFSVLCDAGSKRNTGTDPETCDLCEIGFYQDMDNTNVTHCVPCPKTGNNDTQTTQAEGADSIDACKSKFCQ